MSIGHANATDDWVLWDDGTGNINASWSVDIENRHPEYYVVFMLSVFNIDDNNAELGNDTFTKTYSTNTSYDESGTLSVPIAFSQDFLRAYTNATLVCYIDAIARINNTVDAVNFTSWGQDRCVVGVSLVTDQTREPFTRFTDEANEVWPTNRL